jgi:hypothetical protein
MLKSSTGRTRRSTACLGLALAFGGVSCGNITTAVPPADGGDDAPLDGGADTTPPPVTVGQACTDLDTSTCGALSACSTFVLQLQFGDAATCVARNDLACNTGQAASGVGRTTTDIEGCAQAIPAATCPDLIAGKLPDACQDRPGTVVNGAVCGSNAQCQSTYCRKQNACGVCAPRVAAGESCSGNEQCLPGLVCAAGMSCVAPGQTSASCDDKHPCRDDLYCKANVCSAKSGPGESCADTDKACDLVRGVGCNPFTHVCQNVRIAKKGDPCGIVGGTLVLCEASGMCEGATLATPGTCTAAAGDGEACGTSANGRSCLPPASCANGICRLPANPTCP